MNANITTTRQRPRSLPSVTTRLNTELGSLFVTVGLDRTASLRGLRQPGQSGSLQHGMTELACRLVSLHLRRGTPWLKSSVRYRHQRDAALANRMDDGRSVYVRGLGDAIALVLRDYLAGAGRGGTGGTARRRPTEQRTPTHQGARGRLRYRGRPRSHLPDTQHHGGTTTMTLTIDNPTDVYSRPNARFNGDGTLEIRASAVGNCRRALWYEATGREVTNPAATTPWSCWRRVTPWSRWCCGRWSGPAGTSPPPTGTTPGWSPCASARRWRSAATWTPPASRPSSATNAASWR